MQCQSPGYPLIKMLSVVLCTHLCPVSVKLLQQKVQSEQLKGVVHLGSAWALSLIKEGQP